MPPRHYSAGICLILALLLLLPALESFSLSSPSLSRSHAGGRCYARPSSLQAADTDSDLTPEELAGLSPGRPKINWYPGHIAKAERQLVDYLSCVDVVIEVRDSRIPFSTTHPLVPQWVGAKPHVIVFNRRDCAPVVAISEWRRHFVEEITKEQLRRGRQPGVDLVETPVFSFNAKSNTAVHEIRKACLRLGAHVNEKRRRKGMLPRAIRIAVIGFPNVGKSALINRLIGRKMAKSADTPGVTRQLTWIRLGKDRDGADIELLDSPGIIPAKQVDQHAAEALAMCNDIGSASYEPEHIAVALIERMVKVASQTDGEYVDTAQVVRRLDGFDPFVYCTEGGRTPEEYVHKLADMRHRGDVYGAATRLLNDFRKGMLGLATLEAPPARRSRPSRAAVAEGTAPAQAESSQRTGKIDFDLNTFGVGDFEGW